jgi:hypothetical protein
LEAKIGLDSMVSGHRQRGKDRVFTFVTANQDHLNKIIKTITIVSVKAQKGNLKMQKL